MRIAVLGGAGVLGSLLTNTFTKEGYEVDVVDIQRPYEAWRLHMNEKGAVEMLNHKEFLVTLENGFRVKYYWMYAENHDLDDYDVIIDCAIGNADRPMGLSSPKEVAWSNLSTPLSIYSKYSDGVIIYPSSFNSMYGHKEITQDKLPDPTSAYGWSKAAAELLYRSLAREKGARVIITRVGSAYGPKGRADELPHRLIIDMLSNKEKIKIRSPKASRLWTYSKDVAKFYLSLLEELDVKQGEIKVYHVAGNKSPGSVTNIELMKMIAKIIGWEGEYIEGVYEPGEIVSYNGEKKPISFEYKTDLIPEHTLEDGLKETVEWFKKHKKFYPL